VTWPVPVGRRAAKFTTVAFSESLLTRAPAAPPAITLSVTTEMDRNYSPLCLGDAHPHPVQDERELACYCDFGPPEPTATSQLLLGCIRLWIQFVGVSRGLDANLTNRPGATIGKLAARTLCARLARSNAYARTWIEAGAPPVTTWSTR
jgi:hypothetical protein